jgi:hypothetical protein
MMVRAAKREYGFMLRKFKLEDTETGDLTASIRFIPCFT